MKCIDKAIVYGCLTCMFFVFGYWCGHTNEHNYMVEHAQLVHAFDGGYELTFGTDRVEEYEGNYYID